MIASCVIKSLHLPQLHSILDLSRVSSEIAAFQPDYLIFIDHLPHPQNLINYLWENKKLDPKLKLIFHVYGDFTYFYANWKKLNKPLLGFQCLFLGASERQVRLLSNFFSNSNCIALCPFSIDSNYFRFDKNRRELTRKELGVKEGEKLVLYAGRLSQQKNAILLSQLFAQMIKEDSSIHLILAGPFDDLGAPFFARRTIKGAYKFLWSSWHNELPNEVRSRITYLGNKSGDELLSLYCASDLFTSLSTYHDEDFGMAPLEALSTGLPCVLTDWAGFASFAIHQSCRLIRIDLEASGLKIDTGNFFSTTRSLLGADQPSESERLKVGMAYQRNFSIEHIANKISQLLKQELPMFQGFKEEIRNFDSMSKPHSKAFNDSSSSDSHYSQIYGPYLKEQHDGH